MGNDADTLSRSCCLWGMGVILGSCGATFIAALDKNGAPSVAKPEITFGSSVDISSKADEKPPSWF